VSDRARALQRAALATWVGLLGSVALWTLPDFRIGLPTVLVAGLPLLLPMPGLWRGNPRALRAAPMALTPSLALSITEILANPAARPVAGMTLALVLIAFAAVIAALRARPRD
jgi:uncharacterized membrane protein